MAGTPVIYLVFTAPNRLLIAEVGTSYFHNHVFEVKQDIVSCRCLDRVVEQHETPGCGKFVLHRHSLALKKVEIYPN